MRDFSVIFWRVLVSLRSDSSLASSWCVCRCTYCRLAAFNSAHPCFAVHVQMWPPSRRTPECVRDSTSLFVHLCLVHLQGAQHDRFSCHASTSGCPAGPMYRLRAWSWQCGLPRSSCTSALRSLGLPSSPSSSNSMWCPPAVHWSACLMQKRVERHFYTPSLPVRAAARPNWTVLLLSSEL